MKYEILVYESNVELIERCLSSPEEPALMSLEQLKKESIIVTANSKEEALQKAHEQYTSLNPSGLRRFVTMKVHSRKIAVAQSLEDPPLLHIIYK